MKKKMGVILFLIACIFLFGCTKEETKKNEMYVYYINADGNALIQETYSMMNIDEALEALKYHAVIGGNIKLEEYKLKATRLELYFDTDYFALEKSREVLTRAAIVQTLTQVTGVDFVSFYIGDSPLTNNEGEIVGLMNADDFVQNTGSSISAYKEIDLTLYFADKDGKQLNKTMRDGVRYNVNTPIERLVVEQLMKGAQNSNSQATIPTTTTILGVSVKEGICYVNFDSKFISDSYDLSPDVAIYSIVNSIIENGNVTRVQILIDGASDVTYKNIVDLSRPLERKEDLVKE